VLACETPGAGSGGGDLERERVLEHVLVAVGDAWNKARSPRRWCLPARSRALVRAPQLTGVVQHDLATASATRASARRAASRARRFSTSASIPPAGLLRVVS
jgi:hypothetical protein